MTYIIKILITINVLIISNITVAQTAYIQNKDGSWLKESIEGKNTIFLEFNSEVTIIKDSFPPNSPQWYLVNSSKGEGWIRNFKIGKKWCPEDPIFLSFANKFLSKLKSKENIAPIMYNKWELIYQELDRCNGSTYGEIKDIPKNRIDKIIQIKVFRDGDGWLDCNIDTATYFIEFKLQNKIDKWDELMITDIDYCNKTILLGRGGETEYLKVIFIKSKDSYLIKSIDFRSEDPG